MISGKISSRKFTVILCLLFSGSLLAQKPLTYENFETAVIGYEPVQRAGVSDKDFGFAKMVLRETKLAVEGDEEGFNEADYMNVLTAFLSLKEPQENIDLAFAKLSESDGACEYFTSFGEEMAVKESFAPVREKFRARIAECAGEEEPKAIFDLASYCAEHGLDAKLVKLMAEIDGRDQHYRKDDYDAHVSDQRILDIENQLTVDSLFKAHERYIGESLVGPKFESTMWAVVQHSNERMMKRYLPVFKEAVAEGELAVAPLKMTIDRYYALAYGYQVFGSQAGMDVDLAGEEKRKEIEEAFGIRNKGR